MIALDYLEFSSQPIRIPMEQMLSFKPRQGVWPEMRDGFTTVALPPAGCRSFWMNSRMGLSSWFDTPEISAGGIPFRVVSDPLAVPCTIEEEDLAIDLPAGARELLLLMAASFPTSEKSSWNRAPQSILDLDEDPRFVVWLGDYRPQLLGMHAEEVAFRLYQRCCRLRQTARKALPAMLTRVYAGDGRRRGSGNGPAGRRRRQAGGGPVLHVLCLGRRAV